MARPLLRKFEMKGLTSGEWDAIHWVEPKLLAEVAFSEWTNDGRIRHPSYKGLHEDKPAREVKKETPIGASRHRSRHDHASGSRHFRRPVK